jgi:hypothetical protein
VAEEDVVAIASWGGPGHGGRVGNRDLLCCSSMAATSGRAFNQGSGRSASLSSLGNSAAKLGPVASPPGRRSKPTRGRCWPG